MTRKERFNKELFGIILPDFEGDINRDEIGQGGISNAGVTQTTYDSYTKNRKAKQKPVEDLTAKEIRNFYWDVFYTGENLQKLPFNTSMAIFDFAIQSSGDRAVKKFQETIGTKADGIVGSKTIKRTKEIFKEKGRGEVLNSYYDKRGEYILGLIENQPEKYASVAQGLINRVNKSRAIYAIPGDEPIEPKKKKKDNRKDYKKQQINDLFGKETDFGDAFSQAREQGLDEFKWRGKRYTTEMK